MRKIKSFEWIILIITLFYLLIFIILFIGRKNYEFLFYIGVVAFFLTFVSWLHLKYKFSYFVLGGLSIWGLLHMFGGYFIINKEVLYAYWIFPFLRYDMFVHFFGFFFATLFSYYILKPSLNKNYNKFAVSILLIFIGMGFGVLNEIVEFIAVLNLPKTGVGDYINTGWDLVFNALGAITAVIYLKIRKKF